MNNIINKHASLILLTFLGSHHVSAMDKVLDRISSVFDYISYVSSDKTVTDSEAIQIACEAFGVSPTDAYEKMAYAYFIDGYYAKNEQELEVLAQLGNLGYFPGSVTSKLLVNELTEFINITDKKPVSPHQKTSVEILREFIAGVTRGQWQGEAVDALRARNPQLAFLAKTGAAISISASEPSKDLNELTEKTLISLKQMQPGEIQVFLAGNLVHDTRLMIKKLNDSQWNFLSYDSGMFPSSVSQFTFQPQNDEHIRNFFNNLYRTKLALASPKAPFELLGSPENIVEAHLVSSLQSANTCHFRGLWAALKDFFIRHPKHSLDVALMEWAAFELQFGEFILSQDKIENKSLSILAGKRLEELKRRVAVLKQFENTLNKSSNFNAQIDEYTHILSSTGLNSIPDTLPGHLAKLIFAHDTIINSHAASVLHAQIWKDLLQNQTIDLLDLTWQEIEIMQEARNGLFKRSIKKEFERAESEFYSFCDGLKNSLLEKLITNKFYEVENFLDLTPHFQPPTALNLKEIRSYINRIKKNTHILYFIDFYPCIRQVLRQALQNKRFGDIEELLQSLPQVNQSKIFSFLHAVELPDFYSAAESYIRENPSTIFGIKAPKN